MNKLLIIVLTCFSVTTASSQEVLKLEDALKTALNNNYDVLIEKSATDIAKNNVNLGNAGFLPRVDLNASDIKGTNSFSDQLYSTGVETKKSGAQNLNANAGVLLNWTLFDGLKMFATYDRLKTLDEAERIRLKLQIENTLSQVMLAYYNIIKEASLIHAIDTALKVSEQRVKLSELKFNIGSGSKLEFLQAKVDYNAVRSQFLLAQQQLDQSKSTLNLLLGRDEATNFTVNDSIVISYKPMLEELKRTVADNNQTLKLSLANKRVNEFALREVRAARMPVIGFTTSYNYSLSQSQSGFILSNENLGYNYGLTASFNLFNGFRLNHDIKNAKFRILASDIQLKQQQAVVSEALLRTFRLFRSNLEILEMERDNMKLATENMNTALLRYKLGNLSAIDLQQAQRSFLEAEDRLVSIEYDTKTSEINLMKLNGELVKEP